MIIHGWKFERKKKEKWIVQKDQVKKKKRKEKGLEKKMKKKKIKVQFELYYVKLVELILFEK